MDKFSDLTLKITNFAGQTLLMERISGSENYAKEIDFTQGLYIISVIGSDFEKNTKILLAD